MTRRTPDEIRALIEAEDARDAAELATDPYVRFAPTKEAYRRQFHREIWTWRMDPARLGPLAEAMKAAMQTGRPLSCDEATAITHVSPPPLGADG